MKILYLNRSLAGGGAERLIPSIFTVLERNKCDVQLVVLSPKEGTISPVLAKHQITPVILSQKDRSSWAYILKLRKFLKEYKPDMIWTVSDQATFVAQIATLFTGIKIVAFKHLNMTYPENRFLESFFKSWVSLWVGCESSTVKYLHETVGVPLEKLMVWTMFWTEEKEQRTWLPIQKKRLHFGSLGRFNECKNYEALIEAIGLLHRKYPDLEEKMQLTICGEAKGKKAFLQERIHSLGIGKIVSLEAYRHDVVPFLQNLDLYLQPSLNEALGVAAHEAMALGTPAIVSDVGSLSSAIIHKEDGFLLASPSAEAIAEAIDFFLKNPEKVPEFGKKIQPKILEKYRFEAFEKEGKAILSRCRDILSFSSGRK